MRQRITRDIISTVKIRSDKSIPVIEEVVTSMWEYVASTMAENENNAIYLRFFGTFYGNKEMQCAIENNKGERDGS